jgi:mono/diheme cytochrome c family protein
LFAFIDAQRDSGNVTLANDLTRALAFEDGPSKYIDSLGQGGSKDRIHLGDLPDKFAEKLRDFSQKSGTPLGRIKLSPQEFARPDREFKNGTLTIIRPTTPSVLPPPGDTPQAREQAALHVMAAKCGACHGPGGAYSDSFALKADGTLEDPGLMSRVVARAVKGGTMPPKKAGGKLKDPDIETLKKWAKDKGEDVD